MCAPCPRSTGEREQSKHPAESSPAPPQHPEVIPLRCPNWEGSEGLVPTILAPFSCAMRETPLTCPWRSSPRLLPAGMGQKQPRHVPHGGGHQSCPFAMGSPARMPSAGGTEQAGRQVGWGPGWGVSGQAAVLGLGEHRALHLVKWVHARGRWKGKEKRTGGWNCRGKGILGPAMAISDHP